VKFLEKLKQNQTRKTSKPTNKRNKNSQQKPANQSRKTQKETATAKETSRTKAYIINGK
jgi:predicted DNA-binding protein